MRILVVEDSEDIRMLLEQILEDQGYELLFAENGLEAINQAHAQHPDLILMDLSLPVMTGWEAIEHLRQITEFKQTPIVALTAHASKADQNKALQAGCSSYLSKPFDIDQLLSCVATYAS